MTKIKKIRNGLNFEV